MQGQGQAQNASRNDANARLADKAQHAAEHAKNVAIDRVKDVRAQAENVLSERRHEAADRIRRIGNTLRSTRVANPDDELMGRFLDGASDRADRVAHYIEDADFGRMARDIENLARERPAWFFGGAFILGLAAGRLVKAATGQMSQVSGSNAPHGTFSSDSGRYASSEDEFDVDIRPTLERTPSGRKEQGMP